jgi:hypothetical protein
MSKFFNQYSSILEKNLQRVRLKVDPLNKYAEDFAQYNGYEGYILAETEDAIKFFSNNEIVMIPKKAVVVEGILSGLAGTAPRDDASGRTAIGTIGRNIAGTAARAVFGTGVTGTGGGGGGGSGSQSSAAQNAALGKQVGMTKIPDTMLGKSFKITNRKGIACIYQRGKLYFLTQIKSTTSGAILEKKNFDDLLSSYMTFYEAAPAVPAAPAPTTPAPTTPAAPAVPAAPAPTTPAPTTPAAPAPTVPTKSGIRFVDITNETKNKGLINVSVFITFMENSSKAIYQGYGMFTHIPDDSNYAIAFASVQP